MTNALIEQLDTLTVSVVEAIVQNDTHKVEQLVIAQCQCIKQIDAKQLTFEQRNRLQAIQQAVDKQQELLGQALRVSEFFLERLSESRPFNRIG